MSKHRRAVVTVFLLAVVVRLVFIVAGPGWTLRTEDLTGDAPQFHAIATSLRNGTGYSLPWNGQGPDHGRLRPTANRTPAWPFLLSALYRVTGPSPAAGRLLVVLIDACTAALLVVLGRRLAGPRAGVLAGLLAAVYPPLWALTGTLWSEPLFTLLLVAALLTAVAWRDRPSLPRSALVGAAFGLVTLARPNGWFVTAAVIGWFAWVALRRIERRVALVAVAACMAPLLLLVDAWLVETRHAVGHVAPITTSGGSVVAGDYNDAVLDRSSPYWGWWDAPGQIVAYLHSRDEVSFDRAMFHRGTQWIADHPGGVARLVGLHVLRYFDLYWDGSSRRTVQAPSPFVAVDALALAAWWLIVPAAAFGLIRLRRGRAMARWSPLGLAWGALALSGLLLAASTRYRAPSDPVLLLLAAAGLSGDGHDLPGWVNR